MISEQDMVVLKHDLKEHGLETGDVGTVVHRYDSGEALEVEFVTGEGETIAVVTVRKDDVRMMGRREILHTRDLAHA